MIVDDLLATGGIVNYVSSLLQDQRKEIFGLITVIELKGRLKSDFPFSQEFHFEQGYNMFLEEGLFKLYIYKLFCPMLSYFVMTQK